VGEEYTDMSLLRQDTGTAAPGLYCGFRRFSGGKKAADGRKRAGHMLIRSHKGQKDLMSNRRMVL
jgi:hypothetical protein